MELVQATWAVLLKVDGGRNRKKSSRSAVPNRINQQSYVWISTSHKILSIGPNVNLLIHGMSSISNSHNLGQCEFSSQLGELYSPWVQITLEWKCEFVAEWFRQLPCCSDVAGSNPDWGVLMRAHKMSKQPPTSWIFSHQVTRYRKMDPGSPSLSGKQCKYTKFYQVDYLMGMGEKKGWGRSLSNRLQQLQR